jgi:hypothetical protein
MVWEYGSVSQDLPAEQKSQDASISTALYSFEPYELHELSLRAPPVHSRNWNNLVSCCRKCRRCLQAHLSGPLPRTTTTTRRITEHLPRLYTDSDFFDVHQKPPSLTRQPTKPLLRPYSSPGHYDRQLDDHTHTRQPAEPAPHPKAITSTATTSR